MKYIICKGSCDKVATPKIASVCHYHLTGFHNAIPGGLMRRPSRPLLPVVNNGGGGAGVPAVVLRPQPSRLLPAKRPTHGTGLLAPERPRPDGLLPTTTEWGNIPTRFRHGNGRVIDVPYTEIKPVDWAARGAARRRALYNARTKSFRRKLIGGVVAAGGLGIALGYLFDKGKVNQLNIPAVDELIDRTVAPGLEDDGVMNSPWSNGSSSYDRESARASVLEELIRQLRRVDMSSNEIDFRDYDVANLGRLFALWINDLRPALSEEVFSNVITQLVGGHVGLFADKDQLDVLYRSVSREGMADGRNPSIPLTSLVSYVCRLFSKFDNRF